MRGPETTSYNRAMSTPETFQIPLETAEIYESKFVPALFADWAPHVVDMADVAPGQSVLDVACGTGIVARAAADRVGSGGRVVGVDLNPAMLEVARTVRPDIEWRQGDAEDLPFETGSFDVALCQSALFFFPDPGRAVREMARVVGPAGTVAIQTYAPLAEQPAYGPFMEVIARHAGPEARVLLGTYWSQGDLARLTELAAAAGLEPIETRTSLGVARFPSTDAVAHTEIRATPLVERLDPAAYDRILADTHDVLSRYAQADGTVLFPIRAKLIAARGTPTD
jgi:SAM-dependent methyltransferase